MSIRLSQKNSKARELTQLHDVQRSIFCIFRKISAQPHTSLCKHILIMIHWIKKPHVWMHNEVWGCAEIWPNWLSSSPRPRKICEKLHSECGIVSLVSNESLCLAFHVPLLSNTQESFVSKLQPIKTSHFWQGAYKHIEISEGFCFQAHEGASDVNRLKELDTKCSNKTPLTL